MKNLRDVYTSNGSIEPELLYINLYNNIPSKYSYSVDDDYEIEDTSIKFNVIKDKFKNVDLVRLFSSVVIKNESEVSKSGLIESSFELSKLLKIKQQYLIIAADKMVLQISCDSVTIMYPTNWDVAKIASLAEEVFNSFPKKQEEDKSGKVSLIKMYSGDYYTSTEQVKPTTIDINENYNDDFLNVHKDIVDFLNDRSSGLILLWGAPGTGKTSYIRNLISSVPKEYVIVPNSIAMRLGDPDLTSFITDHTDSVFILEDCEQLLEDRADNIFNNSINTILNMADGLLSDVVNIKFICTFNAPINKIDPALLRKGRCVAKYEFKELCEEKVKIINDKLNLGHSEIKAMTLADLYNPDKPDYSEKDTVCKIGF